MDSKSRALVAALLAMTLFGVSHASHAADRVADPAVWGVYATLVGTSWKGEYGNRVTRWGEGEQIIQDDEYFSRSVITPGQAPGTLVLELGNTGLHTFQGTLSSNGSVLWIRDGMLKMAYRVLLTDGELLEERVKLSGREVASIKRTLRFQQVDGPLASSQTQTVATAKSDPGVAASAAGPAMTVKAETPVAPAVPSGGLEPFMGQRLFSAEGSDFVEFQRNGDGALVIQFFSLNGTAGGRYVIAASPKKPGKLEMLTSAFNNERHYRDVAWQTDGSLFLTSKSGMFGGWFHSYTFRGDVNKVVFRRWGHEVSKIGMFTGQEFDVSGTYVKPTAAAISLAALNEAQSRAQAAEGAREQRQAKIESDRALANSLSIMMGDLSDHAAKERQIRADADAMLADTQRQMMAAQEAQRRAQVIADQKAAEQRRQTLDANARWVAEQEQAAQQYRAETRAQADRQSQVDAQEQSADQQRQAQNEVAARPAQARPNTPSNSASAASNNLSKRDSALADCPYVPRVESGVAWSDESQAAAEAKARAGARCGYGGEASAEPASCTSEKKTYVTMANGKTTTHNDGLRWTCAVKVSCVIGTPVCTGKSTGVSAQ